MAWSPKKFSDLFLQGGRANKSRYRNSGFFDFLKRADDVHHSAKASGLEDGGRHCRPIAGTAVHEVQLAVVHFTHVVVDEIERKILRAFYVHT
jgi:hypothetical protein